jgi:hypothetical protein
MGRISDVGYHFTPQGFRVSVAGQCIYITSDPENMRTQSGNAHLLFTDHVKAFTGCSEVNDATLLEAQTN